MWCCGDRSEIKKSPKGATSTDKQQEFPAHVEKEATPEKHASKPLLHRLKTMEIPKYDSYASLLVKVECAEGLTGMDFGFDIKSMQATSTLDAFVRLSIDDEEAFGKTGVQWHSSGVARWDEHFSVGVHHPQSFLVVKVCDDDEVFSQDSSIAPIARVRTCGWIEIPLYNLPRNETVTGWFKLNDPDLVDDSMSHADRHKQLEEARKIDDKMPPRSPRNPAEGEQSKANRPGSGYIKLHLLMRTTATKEFFAGMAPPPVFKESLPPLDVPQFLEDIQEIKRLILDRLILRPIRCFLYALSWEEPKLSFGLLCWHIFVCYFKSFTSASLWIVFLLCFWHEIPPQQDENAIAQPGQSDSANNVVKGVAKGATNLAKETAEGVKDAFVKPLDGLKTGGVTGFARGMKDGFTGNVKRQAAAWKGMAKNVGDGLGGTLDSLGVHGIGLQEFQNFLLVKPAYANMVRGFQPTMSSIRKSLQQVDDIFYWAKFETTKKVVIAVGVCLAISILFFWKMGTLSGYGWLLIGSLVILWQAPMFKLFVSAIKSLISVCTKPKEAFKGKDWFKAD